MQFRDKSTTVDSGAVVGRERAADVVLAHPDVSRRHAEIRSGADGLEIRDLGSTNGLWIGDSKKDSIPLPVGQTRLRFGPKESAPYIDVVVTELSRPTAKQDLPSQALPAELLESMPRSLHLGASPSSPKAPGASEVPSFDVDRPEDANLNASNLAGNLGELSQVFETEAKTVLIGRSQQCDLVVQDPLVSRRHAELMITSPTSGRIVDLGTDNGTYVNGSRIKSKDIVDGDLIEMGRIQLVLRRGRLEQHVAYGLPLQASNLSVSVDKDVRILSDVSFTVPAGSLTAIVGPSGSGKTTLLNALTSRRPADTGSVFLGGRTIYDRSSQVSQRIGFVPQNDPVHDTLSVRHALTAAAKMRLPQDTRPQEIEQNVLRVAHELGLAERIDTRVSDLSGGQRKRVSVGYELVGEPQALILDEPTSGLDPGLERGLMRNLRELADRGTTTIVVTHSVQSVELCDQVLVLAPGGRLAFLGPPAKVTAHFEVADLASVFTLLSSTPNAEWERRFAETTSHFRFVTSAPAPSVDVSTPRSRRSFSADLATLTARYVRLFLGEQRRLLFLVSQAPLLGVLLALLLNRRAFDVASRSAAREYLVAMVLAMTLIGVLNSVREIVQDRPTFRREHAVGVSSVAFVLSRWLVLVVVVVAQAFVLVFLGSIRQLAPLSEGVLTSSAWLELYLAVAGVGIASVGVGLVVSAFVSDTPKALTMFPLVVIPAVLLSGLVVPTSGRTGVEQLTYLNPIQWGSSAAASVLDLPGTEGCGRAGSQRVNLPNGLVGEETPSEAQRRDLPPSCSNGRWSRTGKSQGVNFVMQSVFNVALLAIAAYGTRRSLALPLRR